MTLLGDNETVYAKFMNNRALCVNGIRLINDTGIENHRIYFHVIDTRTSYSLTLNSHRAVYLRVRGLQFGRPGNVSHTHPGVGDHTHTFTPVAVGLGVPGFNPAGAHQHGLTGIQNTAVPKNVQLWINGTNRTVAIGNPNAKSHWTGSNWGDDGTSEWDTGLLDITSYIDKSVEEHLIELKEIGAIGGRLNYEVYIV